MAHETTGLSPIPTAFSDFENGLYHDPERGPPADDLIRAPEFGLRRAALARGHSIVDSIYAAAAPSAPPAAEVYERLRNRILADLARAMPVDAVLLFLHGAQMAQGCDDCEGDLLARVRAQVGAKVAIGVELDLHGHLTRAVIDHADVIAMCLEYPHTDFAGRAAQVVALVEAKCAGAIEPVSAFAAVPMLGVFHTTREPMRGFVDRAKALEGRGGILSVSIQHGFASSDSPHTHAGILVVANRDAALAQRTADALAAEWFELRERIKAPALPVDVAIDAALEHGGGPVVIADTADNAGGGAGGDSTHLLRRLIERRVQGATVGALWDPQALDIARNAGVGARVRLRIGGKVGPLSGQPVDVDAEVLAFNPDLAGYAFGAPVRLGPHVALRTDGITIVLCQRREQTHSPQVFTELGIDLSRQRIVVVKSAQHFRAAFDRIAKEILYCCPPGTTTTHYTEVPYRRIQRPLCPLDTPPFENFGRRWNA